MNFKKIDMTQGSIIKSVLLFAIPICIGNILQQLYNTVDALVIGNYCGPISLAAVGTSSQPVEILLCVFLGLGTGVSILVSQSTGRGDLETLKSVITTATTFLYLCAIPLSIIGLFLGPIILHFMQVPAEVFDEASTYIRIIFLGTLGNMGYNMNAGILRGIGDSRSSLLFLFISCIINIVLDMIFVTVFRINVLGVALATSISMFASWIISVIYIKKRHPELEFKLFPRTLNKTILKNIIIVGIPLGLNNSLYSIGHVLMQSLTNAQGPIFMAACSVGTKITGMAKIAISSISSAATTFAGQNTGAKNYKRIKQGSLRIPLFSGSITLTLSLFFLFFSKPIVYLFTQDSAVAKLAIRYVYVILPFMWTFAIFNALIAFVNGTGETRYPTRVNLLMLFAVRIPIGYAIALFFDGTFVMVAVSISFVFGMISMLAYFLSNKWKSILQLTKSN